MKKDIKKVIFTNNFDNYSNLLTDAGLIDAGYNVDLTMDQRYDVISDNIQFDLECENDNLRNCNFFGNVICIADLGLWNGNKKGYKLFENTDLTCILNSFNCDSIEIYSDNKNICSVGFHHDGCNKYLFREIKSDITELCKERLLNAIYNNSDNMDYYIRKYTRSLVKYVNYI